MTSPAATPSPKVGIPTAFIWRRIHSLMGLWLVIFLSEHLFVNSQAALWPGDDGKGFINLANLLQAIPALHFVEIVVIGIPILVHTIWGIRRVYSAKTNTWPSDGSKPYLPWYVRNQAFTWQRISSWILIVGIFAHVIQVRFVDYPKKVFFNNQEQAMVRISTDDGLASLARRLQVSLFSSVQIAEMQNGADLNSDWMRHLKSFSLKDNELVAVTSDRGTAILLTVRNMFKDPLMEVLYSLFLLAAVYHAFNGFWTFLLTWGLILSVASQKVFRKVSVVGMIVFALLGLSAIWITFWINLRN